MGVPDGDLKTVLIMRPSDVVRDSSISASPSVGMTTYLCTTGLERNYSLLVVRLWVWVTAVMFPPYIAIVNRKLELIYKMHTNRKVIYQLIIA